MKKSIALIAAMALTASLFVGCGSSDKNDNKPGIVQTQADKPTEKEEDKTTQDTEDKTAEETQAATAPVEDAPAEDTVKVVTFEDLKTTSFEYGIQSNTSTAKSLRIAEVESNTDNHCLVFDNPTDNDIKLSFVTEEQLGFVINIYAHQLRVMTTNIPKSEPLPNYSITSIGKIPESQKLLDKFTTTFKRGTGANDLVVVFEAKEKNCKVMGKLNYNLVKDGVVYFPAVSCDIKSEGNIALRYDQPSINVFSNENAYDMVAIAYEKLSQAVK